MKYIGAMLVLVMMLGFGIGVAQASGFGHGGHYFHSGNNRIHHRLRHLHFQHTQSYIEGGIHVTP